MVHFKRSPRPLCYHIRGSYFVSGHDSLRQAIEFTCKEYTGLDSRPRAASQCPLVLTAPPLTPTLGGSLIVLSATLSTILWAELTNAFVVLALLGLLWMGAIGFMDDYLKIVRGHPRGLVARYKLLGQLSFGLALGLFLVLRPVSPIPST